MAKLAGVGAPTRKTQGAIGDIYTDSKTGQEYVCTFAYKTGNDENLDCEWKKRTVVKKVQTSSIYGEFNKEEKKQDTTVETTIIDELKENTEMPVMPKRKDYSAYSKKSN